jgi:spore germination cell wall hydrolase CwlJ-like protein
MALTIWRENRSGGLSGMQSVANVILNRVKARGTDPYTECVRPLQFTSVSGKGDPELTLWPNSSDLQWRSALTVVAQATAGTLEDITKGALLYYAPHSIRTTKTYRWLDGTIVPFPEDWNAAAVTPLCSIGSQLFFK